MAVVDAVIVNKQALGQVGIGIALNLDVDQQPVFLPVGVDHAHQLVRQTPAKRGVAHHLLELLVEEFIALGPVDPGVGLWKQQGEEVRQVALQGFLPGGVVVVARELSHALDRARSPRGAGLPPGVC